MIVSHLPIKWLLCIDAKSIWLCFAILYVERSVAQKNANERDHLIFIKSSKLLLSSNVFCVLALLMHCISRNLHTLFICVCFFSPHVFIHFFFLSVCMYVCGNEQDKYVSTYGPSFRYMYQRWGTHERKRISLPLCGNHFSLYIL